MLRTIIWILQFIVIPLLLSGFLVFAVRLALNTEGTRNIKPGLAGVVAGVIIFIIFVISRNPQNLAFQSGIAVFTFQPFVTVAGIIVGFLLIALLDTVGDEGYGVGCFSLIAVSTTLIALFCYFFINDTRNIIALASLGVVVGIALYRLASDAFG